MTGTARGKEEEVMGWSVKSILECVGGFTQPLVTDVAHLSNYHI